MDNCSVFGMSIREDGADFNEMAKLWDGWGLGNQRESEISL